MAPSVFCIYYNNIQITVPIYISQFEILAYISYRWEVGGGNISEHSETII